MPSKLQAAVLAILTSTAPSAGQTPALPIELPTDAPAGSAALTPAQLDTLVAPIALYPDVVLTDILAAATYPAQVVEAARFVAANDGLQGAALAEAASSHDWDSSVQALLAFTPVLHLLDGNLEWTDRLGRAFIAQQGDVMDAIQRLRLQAERAGTLQNGPAASVVNDGGVISINPPSPQSVYLPSYDAACVYGGAGCAGAVSAIGWDGGVFLPFGFGQWALLDWGHRCIREFHRRGGDRTGVHGRAAGSGSLAAASRSAWRHAGAAPFAGRPAAPTRDTYSYAPPAGFIRPGYGVTSLPSMAAHFAPPGAPRAGGMAPGIHMVHPPGAQPMPVPMPMSHTGMAPMGVGIHH